MGHVLAAVTLALIAGIAAIASACSTGPGRAAGPIGNRAASPAAPSPRPRCTGDGPWLTIEIGPLRPGCEGGVYLIDGREVGHYPAPCGAALVGHHHLELRSAGDCAGMIACEVDFVAGHETVFDAGTCATVVRPGVAAPPP